MCVTNDLLKTDCINWGWVSFTLKFLMKYGLVFQSYLKMYLEKNVLD